MTRFTRFVLSLAVAGVTLAGAASSTAGAQEGPAARFLKQKHDQAERVLRRTSDPPARARELDALIANLLDYESIARESLGATWTERSEAERAEFVRLLRELVERSYQDNLSRTLDYQIRWGTEAADADTTLVETTARSRANRRAPEVRIDYRMKRVGDRWVVTDVVTDGVSMVRNYRTQFARILRRDGWDGLLDRMRGRLNEGATAGG